jgi:hypothetical protein
MHAVATNDLPLTEHSRARLQQRAIPPRVVDLLMQFGSAFAGRWRIVEMDNWDSDFLDLVGRGASHLRG